MTLIKHSEADRIQRDAIVLDLGDLHRQGELLKQRARDEADRLIAEGKAERERLIADAREVGYEQGRKEGYEAGLKQGREEGERQAREEWDQRISDLTRAWSEALDVFTQQRDSMLLEARQDVLKLAIEMARRVTRRVVELDDRIVEDQIRAVFSHPIRASRLQISVNPEDAELAEHTLEGLLLAFDDDAHVQLNIDPKVSRGSCILRSERGEIDASIETQLDRIVQTLLPDDARSEPA